MHTQRESRKLEIVRAGEKKCRLKKLIQMKMN